ncbi:Txe/YoeB family addiction module toxin [Lacticaseibacillus songhuajiangensis]|jgi:Txe/YoeB family toxin of toxin-antitoxin system|uniref:Txe/YoeB family addiction module toxin n=1 Tax=Lacticaseibacillus songhuajiangensis TaxID=1296539 RepID=UPI000F7A6E0E|nr:Txe/YoeB family addiction module toxin [Lacticaseibacillus songhuajiangensis]
MSEWTVRIQPSAKTGLRKLLKSPLRSKFFEIKAVLESDSYDPSQKFEKLTPPAAGFYSRRLNVQHRVVYKINPEEKLVVIYSCWGHYDGRLLFTGKTKTERN